MYTNIKSVIVSMTILKSILTPQQIKYQQSNNKIRHVLHFNINLIERVKLFEQVPRASWVTEVSKC